MSNIPEISPPLPPEFQLTPDAVVIEASNSRGKTCQLIDNTGTIDPKELNELLAELIQANQFGINALSSTDGVLNLDKPRLSHIQLGDNLYRLVLLRYQAIIENF